MPQVHPQSGPVLRRMETASQQAIRVQLLKPLRIVDIRLAARNRFDMPGIDQQDLKTMGLQDTENRNPGDPSGLHRHGGDTDLDKPIGKSVQITRETLKRLHGLYGELRR